MWVGGRNIVGNQTKNKVTEAVDNHEAIQLVHDTIGDIHKGADLNLILQHSQNLSNHIW